MEQKQAKSKVSCHRMKRTQDRVVPNQRRRKSQVHGIKSLNIMRHSYNHSTVHRDQVIWQQDLINKTHSFSAINNSIHLGTSLFRHYLPGCLLSSGCMGSHHRGASGKKSPRKLSQVLCLIHLASAPPLHHTRKNRKRIWIHRRFDHWMSLGEQPTSTCPAWGRDRSKEHTVCLEQKVRGDLWILPAPW